MATPAPTRAADAPELSDLPGVNQEMVRTREERALERARTDREAINEHVTVRDQFIFQELCKTMPATWMHQVNAAGEETYAMNVMDSVRAAHREAR